MVGVWPRRVGPAWGRGGQGCAVDGPLRVQNFRGDLLPSPQVVLWSLASEWTGGAAERLGVPGLTSQGGVHQPAPPVSKGYLMLIERPAWTWSLGGHSDGGAKNRR